MSHARSYMAFLRRRLGLDFSVLCLLVAITSASADKPTTPESNKTSDKSSHGHAPPKKYTIPSDHKIAGSGVASRLPEDFTWMDVEGENYLTPNWNQHIPTCVPFSSSPNKASSPSFKRHFSSGLALRCSFSSHVLYIRYCGSCYVHSALSAINGHLPLS
jgi:hypothetical protein